MSADVDGRIRQLLREAESVAQLNSGNEDDHKHPDLVSWYVRAKAAVADKVGEKSHLFQEIRDLRFWDFGSAWDVSTAAQLRGYFSHDFNLVVAALRAALEAAKPSNMEPKPLVQVMQHQSGAHAAATSTATVDVRVSVAELRQVIIESVELAPEEQGAAIAALPRSDEEAPTLENVRTLLDIATRAKSLLKPVLGWVLTQADKLI